MSNLPVIVNKQHLRYHWKYLNETGVLIAIVARYDEVGKKKRYHQYMTDENGEWVEGTASPSPLFGLHTLSNANCSSPIYIFEGEKCAQAAHHLGLSALTSMMGSNNAHLADWSLLACYRKVERVILVPDNDSAGIGFMRDVYAELKRALPHAIISVYPLSLTEKGADFIDWIMKQESCPPGWDGFITIDEPYCNYLRREFEDRALKEAKPAEEYFSKESSCPVSFEHDPLPIEHILEIVLPCPIHTFPVYIRDWIQGVADQMQLQVDYLAAPLLVYIGSVIGRKRGICVRQGTDWIEFPNLWGMLIGRPAMMKSPAMESMMKPLNQLAAKARVNFDEEFKVYQKKKKAWELRKKAVEEVYKKTCKQSFENDDSLTMEFKVEDEPKTPIRRRYKTDDSTVEKIGELLIENPQGFLVFRDELSGWLNSFEKQGRVNDRQFYLESWSGKKDFDVDRIGRGCLHVPSLFLSIFGSIQPGPLSRYVRSTVKGGIGDDGFLQRFQVMVWPDQKTEWQLVNKGLDKSIESQVINLFDHLDKLKFDVEGNPVLLNFSTEAQERFDGWQAKLEARLRSGELPSHLEAHLAKYKKLVPALCLILAHLNSSDEQDGPVTIGVETLTGALEWTSYFESHALRVYASGKNAVPAIAHELLKHIRKGDLVEPFSIRDAYDAKHWSGMTNHDDAKDILEFLVEKGWLAAAMVKTGGRPTQKYWVHPKVFEG
jgi:putative DNA primase/helicase